MKAIVVIPTYNEGQNIQELIFKIRQICSKNHLDVLVVDSASPDKTAEKVEKLQRSDHSLYLIKQPGKLGLGKAYLDGMQWALSRDYECLITMDADFSHDPAYLPTVLAEIEHYDFIVGSRYVKGGGLENWPLYRLILSRFANWYAGTLMGMPFADLTSGFQCFRTSLLGKILRFNIHTEGYAFLMELKFLAVLLGARVKEIPIIFRDRTKGESKISKRVIFESMLFAIQRSFQREKIKNAVNRHAIQ